MIQYGPLSYCRCAGCGRESEPRTTGTAPRGWRKFVAPFDGRVTYRCSYCLLGQTPGRGLDTK